MGLIDASKPRSFTPRNGLLAPILETTTTGSMESQPIGGERTGGDPRGSARDQASFANISAMFNDPGFRGDWGKVAAMSGPMALGVGALSHMTGIGNLGNAIQDGFGGGTVNSPAEVYSGGDWSGPANDPNIGGGEYGGLGGNRDGGFAKGGKVKREGLLGPNPPGPDDGYAALNVGERVLNAKQFASLSKEARAEVERALKAKK